MARLRGRELAMVLSAGLVSGCAGSSLPHSSATVSASAYVTALCQAVAPFEKQVLSGAGELDDTKAGSASADRAALATYFGALAADSATAERRLALAGVPDVPGGRGFATAIHATFARISVALSRSRTEATQLPTSSPAAFKRGADKLATGVKRSLGHLGSGVSTQKSQALSQAAAKVPACHTL